MTCQTSKPTPSPDLLPRFIDAYVCCSRCQAPELDHFQYENAEKSGKDLCAICFACGKEQKKDNIHKAGRLLMKIIGRFYKAFPNLQQLKQHGGVIPQDKEAGDKKVFDAPPAKANEILLKQTSFEKIQLDAQVIGKCDR